MRTETDNTPWRGFGALLVDLIQLYAHGREPCVLICEHPRHGRARLGLQAGNLVYASLGAWSGEEAFYKVLSWRHGQILQRLSETSVVNIDKPLSNLMLDAFWHFDQHDLVESLEAAPATIEIDYLEGSQSVQKVLEGVQRDFFWNEELRRRLSNLKGLMGFSLLSGRGELLVRVDLVEGAEKIQAPSQTLSCLGEVTATSYELLLCVPGIHHIVVYREHLGLLVHGFFDTEKINLAMAKWHLEQVLSTPLLAS